MNKIIKWILKFFKNEEEPKKPEIIIEPKIDSFEKNVSRFTRAERRRMWLNSWYKFRNL